MKITFENPYTKCCDCDCIAQRDSYVSLDLAKIDKSRMGPFLRELEHFDVRVVVVVGGGTASV